MIAPETTSHKERQGLSNLALRLLTALVGAPLALAAAYSGGWLLAACVAVLGVVALLELDMMGRRSGIAGSRWVSVAGLVAGVLLFALRLDVWFWPLLGLCAAATFVVEHVRPLQGQPRGLPRALLTAAGLLYIGLPVGLLLALRGQPEGFAWLLFVLIATWATDSLAYVGGRVWGRVPLAPTISPKKTVEGALAGLVGGALFGAAVLALTGHLVTVTLPLVVICPLAAIAGDLFESWMKRRFHAGDSHLSGLNLIPGHGGVLDRIDSLIWSITVCWVVLLAVGLVG
jgi:phosphatidate cytidylyltransferase